MLALRDQVMVAFKLVSDEDIDGIRVAEFLELLAEFLRLAIAVMHVVLRIDDALNAWADSFWNGFDAFWDDLDEFIANPRWILCPVRVAAMG